MTVVGINSLKTSSHTKIYLSRVDQKQQQAYVNLIYN